jgi:phage tail-like protein
MSGPAAPPGRRLAPVTGTAAWRRCVRASTVVDPVLEEVLLEGTPVGVQGSWDPTAAVPGPAGLCFDAQRGLYHADPETGRLRRHAWPDVGAAPPVDLFGPTAPGSPAPPPVEPASDPAGFRPETAGPRWSPVRPVALAVDADHHLMVLDSATRTVAVVDLVEGRVVHTIGFEAPPRDLVARDGAVVALTADRRHPLLRIDALGVPREVRLSPAGRRLLDGVPDPATPSRIAAAPDGALWLLMRHHRDAWLLPATPPTAPPTAPAAAPGPRGGGAPPAVAWQVPGATDLEVDGDGRLVLAGPAGGDLLVRTVTADGTLAVDRPLSGAGYDGRGISRAPDGRIAFWTDAGPRRARPHRTRYSGSGWVGIAALDGQSPGQVWGRVFVEACVPPGTLVEVGCATADELPPPGADSSTAPPGITHLRPLHRRETGRELPWTPLGRDDRYEVYEAPVIAPAGRYLWLRLALTGTVTLTPHVRAVRVECDSHPLVDQLPRVYREDPVAESQLRRYLALVDGLLGEMADRATERDRILDPRGAPPELLPWLASLVGLALDDRWSEASRRTLLAEAICLFRRRGTVPGLRRLLEIYLGCPVTILESFRVRGHGGALVGGAADRPGPASAVVGLSYRVGGTGRPTGPGARPEDAFDTHAHRFTVLVTREVCEAELAVIGDLLDLDRPAHTLVEVCGAGEGMRVGRSLHVELSSIVGRAQTVTPAVADRSRVGDGTVVGRGRAGVRPGLSRLDGRTVVDP